MKKKTDLQLLYNFREIVEAYEEIASIRMQRVKDSVLANRDFLEGMKKIYAVVKINYINTTFGKAIMTKRTKKKSHVARSTNGRTLTIFLSSNTGLYGDIVRNTFLEFLNYVKNKDVDIAIVGNTGKKLYESLETSSEKKPAFYFSLSDTFEDKNNMETLMEFLVQYENVVVFYGQYKTMLSQIPQMSLITGDMSLESTHVLEENKKVTAYIFEPNIQEVLAFFEKEILASMFEHTVHESSLSRFASRMISLDRATGLINERISVTKVEYQKERHMMQSKKQINQLSSIYGRIKHAYK